MLNRTIQLVTVPAFGLFGIGLLFTSCFEDEGDDFGGVVRCDTGKAPRLQVSLSPGGCDYIPRCDGFIAHWIRSPEYEVDTFIEPALGRPFSATLDIPPEEAAEWWLSPDGMHPDLEIKTGVNPRICVRSDATAPDDKQLYAWSGILHTKEGPTQEERVALPGTSFVVEFLITVRRPVPVEPAPDAGITPDSGPTNTCGDGIPALPETCDDLNTNAGDGCDSDCQVELGWICPTPGALCQRLPSVSIGEITMSPELPGDMGFSFAGVTNYMLVPLSSPEATVEATCTDGPCTGSLRGALPRGEENLSAVTISALSEAGEYIFDLDAKLDNAASPTETFGFELREGVGELRCEYASNGLPGAAEERWIGLQLVNEAGVPIPLADYELYTIQEGVPGWTRDELWSSVPKDGVSRVVIMGGSAQIANSTAFLALAFENGASPPSTLAAREFRYREVAQGPTRGCRQCSRGPSVTCEIIPPE